MTMIDMSTLTGAMSHPGRQLYHGFLMLGALSGVTAAEMTFVHLFGLVRRLRA